MDWKVDVSLRLYSRLWTKGGQRSRVELTDWASEKVEGR
jgi:hypothetical protein